MARQSDTMSQAQSQVLDLVRQSQEAVVKALYTWSESIGRMLPDMSAVPVSDQYFNPGQAVDTAFDFAERMLATQRQFAREILAATGPVIEAAQEKGTPDRTSGSQS